MIEIKSPTDTDQRLALALVESDRRYFELAARTEQLPLGQLCWMEGLHDLAASCVVQRVTCPPDPDTIASCLDSIDSILRSRSIPRARIYVDDATAELQAQLRAAGYESRSEIGFLAPVETVVPPATIQLHRVESAADWHNKLVLHAAAMEGPDGYTNQADLWVEMERRKCETGNMQMYLIVRDGQVVATVGTIINAGLLRLKNIVVKPEFRRQGIALATVQHLRKMAEADHNCRLGVFGVAQGTGSCLYHRAGLYAVIEQQEWSKILRAPSS